jgi:putative membrane protein
VLLGCGLYYGVLFFNLGMTFWIGEALMGLTGTLMYFPVTALLLLRLFDRFPPPVPVRP